ncbi:extracellular solute-binding protein [Pseudobythopirellula maris]|nr:extracellular solute-binding protein [Pseudobythopirellula maris]
MTRRGARHARIAQAAIALAAVAFAGCPAPNSPPEPKESTPRGAASVTLRVAVENDASLAAAIRRLRGEWNAQGGGELEVVEVEAGSLLSEEPPEADLCVFASRHLGQLSEAGLLRPLRSSVVGDETLRFNDFLPRVREDEIAYGTKPWALPLGCPPPLLLYGGDNDAPPPASWEEVAQRYSWTPPESDHELALAYLAWAAPSAVHRSFEATLFDSKDMTPRLTAPPFVRALGQMVEAAGAEGRPRVRVVWPEREAGARNPVAAHVSGGWQVAPLPGATQAFNPIPEVWDPFEGGPQRASLIASSGRLIAVTSSSRNAAEAFRLAAWLAGPENTRMLATSSDSTANPRGSLARGADDWLGHGDRDRGGQFAAASVETLRSGRRLITPRLVEIDSYLAALGAEVRRSLAGEAEPTAALDAATAAWEAITDRVGRERQRRVYQRSLGLAD